MVDFFSILSSYEPLDFVALLNMPRLVVFFTHFMIYPELWIFFAFLDRFGALDYLVIFER